MWTRVPTLHHVPKAARDDWARLVGDVFSSLSSSMHDYHAWCKCFMLARCILASPSRGGRSHWREILKLVRHRIQKWREGKIADLWEDVVACVRAGSKPKLAPSVEAVKRGNSTRARQAVADGQY